ncbi:copper chaperone PCu(A)C [Streptomyces sp. NPDC050211]|uniref:copper chaperone PCu(A)C n=1 Tax=Streptomyces sp. NPDC050211 TaxID=3154932 RepID=UPI00343DE4AB
MTPRSLFTSALRSAAVPLGACCAALILLTAYAMTGLAGDPPPRITVVDARIIAPPRGASSTTAYFEIRNTGVSRDTLLYADSPELGVSAIRRTGGDRERAGLTEQVWSVDVPAGGTVRMAPDGLGVLIMDPPALKPGREVLYNLWFRYSGRVGVRVPVTTGAR